MILFNNFTGRTNVWLLAAFVFFSCGRKESPQSDNPPTLLFHVDTLLVEPLRRDTALGIAFAAPKGWKRVEERLLRRAEETAMKNVGLRAVAGDARLLYGYVEPNTGGVITIARVVDFDTSNVSLTMQRYQDRALQMDSSATVHSTVFYHHGLKIHQLLISNPLNVSFITVLSSSRLDRAIRFDFAFPREVYPRFARTIESVLGSVELL